MTAASENNNILKNGFLRPQVITNTNKEINQFYTLKKQNTTIIEMPNEPSAHMDAFSSSQAKNVQRSVKTATHTNQDSYLINSKPKTNITLNLNDTSNSTTNTTAINNSETLLGSKKAREAFLERLKFTEELKNNINKVNNSRVNPTHEMAKILLDTPEIKPLQSTPSQQQQTSQNNQNSFL